MASPVVTKDMSKEVGLQVNCATNQMNYGTVEPPESPIASRQQSNRTNIQRFSPSKRTLQFGSNSQLPTTNILENDSENESESKTPSWIENLDDNDRDLMVELLTQACTRYGGFNRAARDDLITKFGIEEFQCDDLFKFVYQSPDANTFLSPPYQRDSILGGHHENNHCGSDHNLHFENDEEAYHHIKILNTFARNNYTGRPKLPPLSDPNKYTLCLDLDETLVHCHTSQLSAADLYFDLEFDGNLFKISANFRPHLQEFLQTVSQWYELTIFTASQKLYADKIINYIDPDGLISHRLYREDCTNVYGNYIKDLSTLGRDLKRTVFIDNSPQAFSFQLNNSIPILSWYRDRKDTELVKMTKILSDIRRQENVQPYLNRTFGIEQMVSKAQKP